LLVGGVKLQHAFAVANQVCCALLDTVELGVELVPAGVVVADQVTGVAVEYP
jgi:hypothetical protein